MLSATLDTSGSPKKRTFSRGLSEDESLRSIIKETENSSRRLTRSDSRAGTLKRRTESQSEQELFMGLPEMLELQASYDEVVQELRGLEVEREALLFQVDVLQDTLEGVEELLAEAQREAGHANSELEQEREAKRKLENMYNSLMQEMERLKQEGAKGPGPVYSHESEEGATQHRMKNQDANEHIQAARRDEIDSSPPEPRSTVSEEAEQGEGGEDEDERILLKLRKIVNKSLSHVPSLALDNLLTEDGVHQRPCENSADDERDLSPDTNDSDNLSAYEDASADTPEHQRKFGDGDSVDLPHDSEDIEKSPINNGQVNNIESQDPKNPEACIIS